ncbi:c-type cytochrome [Rhodobacter maris]|uniref:Cytochrome c556 n=1 Tax=Rhodobacter maris TaxID=446682 RepID=A0A285SCA9_9RHOB|nr:cytochrome c [Rhodobacter maris]SOC05355.1 cytochrome c556 [Rhodobacter maris]
MQRFTPVLSLFMALALGGGAALAEEVKDPDVKARIALMQDFKTQMKVLGEAGSGKVPFDAARVAAAIDALTAGAGEIAPRFRPQADDPASEALPEIWAAPSEFRQKTNRMIRATGALDGESAGALAKTLDPVQAACKDCHGRFKM